FVAQLERSVTCILDELAPIKNGSRQNGRKSARWLSPEAVNAKRLRRRLERCWKSTGEEKDRLTNRVACRDANYLINTSRNRHRYERIAQVKGDSHRVWSAVKDLLNGEHSQVRPTQNDNDTFCI